MARTDSSSSFSVSEELTLIPRWSIVLAFVAFVGIQYLLLRVAYRTTIAPFQCTSISALPGGAGCGLHADDRLYQRGRAAPQHGQMAVDLAVYRFAGWHRPGAVFSCATTGPLAVPLLRHQSGQQHQLLSPMRLSCLSKLRHLPRKRPRHRPSLHSLRTRSSR